MSANEALLKIGEFVAEYEVTIINALGNQARRMGEAADMAEAQGQPNYAKLFRQDSETATKTMTDLYALLEGRAEELQDNFVDQG